MGWVKKKRNPLKDWRKAVRQAERGAKEDL